MSKVLELHFIQYYSDPIINSPSSRIIIEQDWIPNFDHLIDFTEFLAKVRILNRTD